MRALPVRAQNAEKAACTLHTRKDSPPPSPCVKTAVEAGLLVGPAADPAPGPEHDGENDENT